MNTRTVSQPAQALAIGAIVMATLFGAFVLAINDRALNSMDLPGPIETLVAVGGGTPIGTQVAPPSALTPGAVAPTGTLTPTPTPTLTPTPICPPPPASWSLVEFDQTQISLFDLARRYNTTYERLIEVNCLDKIQSPVQQLWVPLATTPTAFPTPYLANCAPPLGWVSYIVRWGDSLYGLSVRYNVPIEWLMRYNCLNSTWIYQGQRLYVPFAYVPPTWTPLPTWTPTLTLTPIVVTPTDTPTPTWTPLPVVTDTPEPPITPTTEVPTETPPTIVPPTPTPTFTPSPTLPPPPTETPAPPATPTVEAPTLAPPTAVPPTETSVSPTVSAPTQSQP